MDLGNIRARIKTRIDASVSGFTGYTTVPTQPVVPAYIVMPATGEFLTEVTQDGCEDVDIVVLVLFKKVAEDVAQDTADDHVSEGASVNIANAIESGSTADWDYAICNSTRGYGQYAFGAGDQAQVYLGYEIPVQIGVS
jgi:hypothetical protein